MSWPAELRGFHWLMAPGRPVWLCSKGGHSEDTYKRSFPWEIVTELSWVQPPPLTQTTEVPSEWVREDLTCLCRQRPVLPTCSHSQPRVQKHCRFTRCLGTGGVPGALPHPASAEETSIQMTWGPLNSWERCRLDFLRPGGCQPALSASTGQIRK